jgi:hypothetical protein
LRKEDIMKRIIAAVIAISLTGGCVPQVIEEYSLISNAFDAKKVTDGFLTYTVYSDYAEVLKCSDKVTGEIVISSEIEGVPVTRICENAFLNCSDINSVSLPEGIRIIGESAFEGCTSLVNFKNQLGIKQIGPSAFKGCTSLESFSNPIPINSADQIIDCTALIKLELADTGEPTLLTNLTLKNFSKLESFSIPDNYVLNSNFTMNNCPMIKEIKLPVVSSLESVVISDCSSLTNIIFPETFSDDKSSFSISQCSSLSAIDLSVSDIANVTIEEMPALEKIIFRKNQKIKYKIANCEKLNNLTRSLTFDSELSYETCTSLKDVYYYEETSEKCHIPDVMLLAKNGITLHIWKSNNVLQEYLDNNKVKYVFIDDEPVKGDANLDGQLNIADAVLVMQVATNPDKYAQGKSGFSITAQGEINADVDGKAGLTNEDALLIQKYKLGLIDKF